MKKIWSFSNVNREKLENSIKIKLCLSRINSLFEQPLFYLKPKQVDGTYAAVDNSVLCVLPTGYGKTVLFSSVPVYYKLSRDCCTATIALVISPLNAIISQQKAIFGSRAIVLSELSQVSDGTLDNADSDSDTSDDEQTTATVNQIKCLNKIDWKKNEVWYILGHPEDFLKKPVIRVFTSAVWNKYVTHIFVDEAHCVLQWGDDTFRPKYRELHTLHSIFSEALFVAVTATATVCNQREICRLLGMDNVCVISTSGNRENIKYVCLRRPPHSGGENTAESSYHSCFLHLAEELRSKGQDFPKTIVYTGLKWCGVGHQFVNQVLNDAKQALVGVNQYHAHLPNQIKSDICQEFAKKDSSIRLLLATEAFGMGVDIADIQRVVHIGSPTNLESYVQQTGRAGRTGISCLAVLYYNMEDIGRSTVTGEMREFCLLNTCRRQFIAEHFGYPIEQVVLKHNCCDNCEGQCQCDVCNKSSNTSIIDIAVSDVAEQRVVVSQLSAALLHLFDMLNSSSDDLINHASTMGLSTSLASEIASKYTKYTSEDSLLNDYCFLSSDVLNYIYQLIEQYRAQ